MGILDMLTSVMAARAAKELDPAVIPAILGEVLGSDGAGGLSAIVAKLQQAGLGDQVKSWIGNGTNLPISAHQLQEVLGNDVVKQLATRFGIPVDQLSTVLALLLPDAVDKASPDGTLPHHA
ncbi:MAG: DUF937 domain-containing protein [Afipia sp.]|nr:DUF937 domain-containing protein [Afipia sp.]